MKLLNSFYEKIVSKKIRKTVNEIKFRLRWLDPFTYVDLFLMPRINPNKNKSIESIVYLISALVFAFLLYNLLGLLFSTQTPLVIVVSDSMVPNMFRGDVIVLIGSTGPAVNADEINLNENIEGKFFSEFASVQYYSSDKFNEEISKIVFSSGEELLIPRESGNDAIVYTEQRRGIQIIHRVIAKIKSSGKYYFLTKGDNNPTMDQDCGQVKNVFIPGTDVKAIASEKQCISLYPILENKVDGKAVLRIPLIGFIKLLLIDDPLQILGGCLQKNNCRLP